MTVRAFIVMAALAGCGQPTPLLCNDNAPCLGGVCIAQYCADPDLTCESGYRYGDSAGPNAGECTGSGNGGGSGGGSGDGGESFGDQVAMLVLDGSPTTVNAATAQDDVAPSCATAGGVDVMFQANVTVGGVLYVDTLGTSFDAVLAVYAGTCADVKLSGAADDACISTGPNACSATTKQWATLVAPGSYCFVVDQATSNATHATATVRAKLGPPAAPAQMGANTATTCGRDYWPANCAGDNGEDATWFFSACGGSFSVDPVSPTTWVGDLQVFGLGAAPVICDLGANGAPFSLAQPGPAWVVAHEIDTSACTTNLTISITRQP